jgi:ADP-heptose:LPS heptosyltransferase
MLMGTLKKLNIKKVYDLQNSSRTKFYKNILFSKANFNTWSSSETTLPNDISKEEFDKNPVLERFDHQLKTSGIKTEHTMKPNFSWAVTNIVNIKQEFKLDKYIVLFPFCSAHLTHKKWPHYNELIELIKNKYDQQIKVVVAPGPSEIDDAKSINAISILNQGKALDISQLASLVKESSFVVANDTGPAHISAHLGVKGLTLFGKHTTAYKVSIEREYFKAIQVDDLEKLSAAKVLEKISI